MNVILQYYKETLPAGTYRPVYAYAKNLTILSNTISDQISIGIGELSPVPLKAGLQYELPQGDHFNKLLLYNQAASGTTVEFILSNGTVRDNRLSISGSVFSGIQTATEGILEELQGDVLPQDWGTEKTVGIAAVEILNAETDRKSAFIQSKQVNTGLIYVGFDNTVSTSKWVAELQPGAAFSVDDYRGPLFAISDTAAQLVGWGEW